MRREYPQAFNATRIRRRPYSFLFRLIAWYKLLQSVTARCLTVKSSKLLHVWQLRSRRSNWGGEGLWWAIYWQHPPLHLHSSALSAQSRVLKNKWSEWEVHLQSKPTIRLNYWTKLKSRTPGHLFATMASAYKTSAVLYILAILDISPVHINILTIGSKFQMVSYTLKLWVPILLFSHIWYFHSPSDHHFQRKCNQYEN